MKRDHYILYDIEEGRDLAILEAEELEVAGIVHRLNSLIDRNWKVYLLNKEVKTLEEISLKQDAPKLNINLISYRKFRRGDRDSYLKKVGEICSQNFFDREFLSKYVIKRGIKK